MQQQPQKQCVYNLQKTLKKRWENHTKFTQMQFVHIFIITRFSAVGMHYYSNSRGVSNKQQKNLYGLRTQDVIF